MHSISTLRRLLRSVAFILSIAAGGVGAARGQAAMPLADHVPGDAVVYLGWAGADSQSAAYRDSQFSAFIEHSNLPELAKKYVPQWWDQLAGKSGDPKEMAALQKVLPLLWQHPAAVYASGVSIGGDGTPKVEVGLICDAGADAAQLESDIKASLASAGGEIQVSVSGTLVTLTQAGAAAHAGQPMLAANPRFITAMKSLQAAPAIAVYVDMQTILAKVDEATSKDPQASVIWPKVQEALGIGNVKSIAVTAGFSGTEWMTAARLEAPGPRTGLLAVIEPQPIDPFLLARIPASAGTVSVYNFDTARLFDTIAGAMAASKESDTMFHQVAGGATMVLGRNLRRELLGSLGPQWVMYSDSKSHSAVLMNHPNDADAAGDSMVSALFGIVNLANSQIPGAAKQPMFTIDQKNVKGLDLTSAVTKLMSPTVTVKDKVLYWGLSSDSVVTAANAAATASPNDLLHNPDFLAIEKKLGVTQLAGFDYCDLPRTAPAAYANFGAAGDQVRQLLSTMNIDFPKIELPPLESLHLSPAMSVTWSDADGIYSKSISPFPGSEEVLGDPQQAMVSASTVSGLAAAVVLPALDKARASAARVATMANERQILLGMILYANDHHGDLPTDFGSIVSSGYLGSSAPKVFLQPNSKTDLPAEILTGTKDQQASWVNDHAEYLLLKVEQKITRIQHPSRTAVLVPVNADQATGLVPVGFVDGHCEMLKAEKVKQMMHPDEQANP